MDHEEFFERFGQCGITIDSPDTTLSISVEDLYQQFKARLVDELQVFSGCVYAGSLEDRS